ncbi:MAG: hypothetical protein D8M22_07090 [Armatimonadetes bacterium]|nr:hypothetical protein [Armatimonadota bacterium]
MATRRKCLSFRFVWSLVETPSSPHFLEDFRRLMPGLYLYLAKLRLLKWIPEMLVGRKQIQLALLLV